MFERCGLFRIAEILVSTDPIQLISVKPKPKG
jgi:hypothetical protein